jgi:hypothetical protein
MFMEWGGDIYRYSSCLTKMEVAKPKVENSVTHAGDIKMTDPSNKFIATEKADALLKNANPEDIKLSEIIVEMKNLDQENKTPKSDLPIANPNEISTPPMPYMPPDNYGATFPTESPFYPPLHPGMSALSRSSPTPFERRSDINIQHKASIDSSAPGSENTIITTQNIYEGDSKSEDKDSNFRRSASNENNTQVPPVYVYTPSQGFISIPFEKFMEIPENVQKMLIRQTVLQTGNTDLRIPLALGLLPALTMGAVGVIQVGMGNEH